MPDSNVRVKKTCRGHVFSGRGLMNASARTEPNRRAGRYRKMNTSILHQKKSASLSGSAFFVLCGANFDNGFIQKSQQSCFWQGCRFFILPVMLLPSGVFPNGIRWWNSHIHSGRNDAGGQNYIEKIEKTRINTEVMRVLSGDYGEI